jgi:TonB family protein
MQREPQKVSEQNSAENLGSLRGCLVDGDADQRTRERHIRRRALAISIIVQGAVLTLLVLFPLFGKTDRIALGRDYIPIPSYGPQGHHPHGDPRPATPRPNDPGTGFRYDLLHTRPYVSASGPVSPSDPPDGDPTGPGPIGPGCDGCIDIGGKDIGPHAPGVVSEGPIKPQIIRKTHIDPGMLLHRVEPVYPPLPKQMHREGRVELRAIIGTDGSIQSLQVVAGDPLFLQSAIDAVQQWHYKPTYLNGQAVEVDTYITVVYTMKQ